MIPLEALFIIWLMGTIASAAAAVVSFKAGNKSMGFAFVVFWIGAAAVLTFYYALLFTEIAGNMAITIPWSRWVHSINGLAVLSSSIAAYIVHRKRG